jgi:hypothetical protein
MTSFGTNVDEKLDDETFTAKYGDTTFNQYQMVDPEEFESDDNEYEVLEDEFLDDAVMDEDEVTNKRTALVTHFSSST